MTAIVFTKTNKKLNSRKTQFKCSVNFGVNLAIGLRRNYNPNLTHHTPRQNKNKKLEFEFTELYQQLLQSKNKYAYKEDNMQ